MSLLGLPRLAGAHTGKQLDQVLYKVVERVSIKKKVCLLFCTSASYSYHTQQSGHITSDNTSVNSVMMVKYKCPVHEVGDKAFWAKEREIGCKFHVVNLGSQKMIKMYSQTAHFDPKDPEAHHPET